MASLGPYKRALARGLCCTLLHTFTNTLRPSQHPLLHTQHVPEAVGLTFGQARSLFPRAVLCGLHDPQVSAVPCTACTTRKYDTVYGLSMYCTVLHCTVASLVSLVNQQALSAYQHGLAMRIWCSWSCCCGCLLMRVGAFAGWRGCCGGGTRAGEGAGRQLQRRGALAEGRGQGSWSQHAWAAQVACASLNSHATRCARCNSVLLRSPTVQHVQVAAAVRMCSKGFNAPIVASPIGTAEAAIVPAVTILRSRVQHSTASMLRPNTTR